MKHLGYLSQIKKSKVSRAKKVLPEKNKHCIELKLRRALLIIFNSDVELSFLLFGEGFSISDHITENSNVPQASKPII